MHLITFAYEDVIVTTDGKLTDISIENNSILDVYPLITIMNDKNTLFFHPLKTGTTSVCVLKNEKEKILFNVEISENITKITDTKGFDILSLDAPPEVFELDLPPQKLGVKEGV
jgi:hypothetical protein